MTSPGCTGTTRKPNPSRHSGSIPHHQDQRRPAKCAATSKMMLTAFFDSRGVVYHEYAPHGQTINKEYYRDILRHLSDAVRRKRQDLWSSGYWRLQHDNAPANSPHLIQNFLAKNQITVLQQAPYCPDMAPCDFWLLRKLKRPL